MAQDDAPGSKQQPQPIDISGLGRRRLGRSRGQAGPDGRHPAAGPGEAGRGVIPGRALAEGEVQQKPIAPPAEMLKQGFTNAKDAMAGIGRRFTETRSKNRIKAWQQLQTDLMENMGTMCPYVIAPDKVINTAMQIEDYLKGTETREGGNPVEVIEKFLNSPVKEV